VRRCEKDWDRPDPLQQTELDRRISQLVQEPSASYLIHPPRHGRGDLSSPEQTELALLQGCEGR